MNELAKMLSVSFTPNCAVEVKNDSPDPLEAADPGVARNMAVRGDRRFLVAPDLLSDLRSTAVEPLDEERVVPDDHSRVEGEAEDELDRNAARAAADLARPARTTRSRTRISRSRRLRPESRR